MRDPKRIREFLDVVAHTWERAPDYRFGQLIAALQSFGGIEDPFYMEEEDWIELMHRYQGQFND